MRRVIILACLALGGCNTLGALTAANRALLPELLPADLRIHTDLTCSDIARQALSGFDPQVVQQINAKQALDIVSYCERRDDTMTLKVNPQAAREAFREALKKPPIAIPVPAVP